MPATGSTIVSNRHDVPQYALLVRLDPSGFRTIAVALYVPYVPPVPWTRIRCPAVPGNVTTPFCPGLTVVTVTGAPPGVVLTVASTGTSNTCTVRLPTAAAAGSTSTVQVPAVGSGTELNAQLVAQDEEPAALPFGARSVAVTLPPPNAPAVRLTVTTCPAVPGNDTTAFCPGTVVVTDTAAPPGVVVAEASAGTAYTRAVSAPTAVVLGSTSRV